MQPFTYLHLLAVTVVVIVMIGLAFVIQSPNSIESQLNFIMSFVAIGGALTIVFFIFHISLKNRDSIWLQPVSARTSKNIINFVVVSWLCVAGLAAFVLMKNRSYSLEAIAIVAVAIIATTTYGRYLKKRLSSATLLAYGISSVCMLILMLFIFVMVEM